jgi:hypothetical protein
VLVYDVGRHAVQAVAYVALRTIHHYKRRDLNILVLEHVDADAEGARRHVAIASGDTALIKGAIVAMIQRHTTNTARPKDPSTYKLANKISKFVFGM